MLGELGLLQFHASICILSLLCMASCFFTPLLLETTSCKRAGQGWQLVAWKKPLETPAEGWGAGSGEGTAWLCALPGVLLSHRGGSPGRGCCGVCVFPKIALLRAVQQQNYPFTFLSELFSSAALGWANLEFVLFLGVL